VARPIYEVHAEFFKTLAHPARLRVLEALSGGERPVNELLPLVGIEPSHLSQQLAVLRRGGVVRSRREGSSVIYDVIDQRLFRLLDVAKGILTASLTESQDLLRDLERIEFKDKKARKRSK
jgi:DNA-binding transcriptional ArsR family regulator